MALLLVLILLLVGCGPKAPVESGGTGDGMDATEEPPTGATDGTEVAGFRVGYGRKNITPEESVPLAGYGNTSRRMSEGFFNYLYTICIAISDESDNTVLLVVNDLLNSYSTYVPGARAAISEATGIAEDHIMISSTHTHSGPDVGGSSATVIEAYISTYYDQVAKAAQEALEDRKPAQMFIGNGETEKHNFVRRYELENGTWAGDNFGDFNSAPIKGHESEADRDMRVIRFAREGAKDVVLVSWQSHPHMTGGSTKYVISSDIIGEMRDTLEAGGDYLTAYFQGGAGNINPWSKWGADNVPGSRNWREVGQSLAQTAMDILGNMTQVETGAVQTKQVMYAGTVEHAYDNLIEVAREINQVWTSTNNRAEADAMGAPYGINSPYHAQAIISRSSLPSTLDIELDTVVIGNVAFTFAPFEQFDTNAKYIRDHSPYAMTFAVSYSNNALGYMPSYEAFNHGGYEVDTCKFVQGTGEEISEELVNMLCELQN